MKSEYEGTAVVGLLPGGGHDRLWRRIALLAVLGFVAVPALLTLAFAIGIAIAPVPLPAFEPLIGWPALGKRIALLAIVSIDVPRRAAAALCYVVTLLGGIGWMLTVVVAWRKQAAWRCLRLSVGGAVAALALAAAGIAMGFFAPPFDTQIHRETALFDSLTRDVAGWFFGTMTVAGCLALLIVTLLDIVRPASGARCEEPLPGEGAEREPGRLAAGPSASKDDRS